MAEKVRVEVAAEMLEVRPEVARFALLMEARLKEKDEERGRNSWKGYPPLPLALNCCVCADSLRDRVDMGGGILEKAADTANFAMMVADVVGGLEP